ncbi:hypothetical protein MHU86_7912 [Fragilaria crotonensis]|nr:hypothetical protein MHU86_7912 [Fragilaria crotonensis]
MMQLTLTSKCVILALLTLSTSCWATTSLEEYTDQSADSSGGGSRVRIPPFTLTFSPTSALTGTQQHVIKLLAEDALLDFFITQVSQGTTVDFVSLVVRNQALVRRRQLQDSNATAVLPVAGGIASFHGGEPSVDEVNAWTSQALEGNLLELLHEETVLTTVDSIVFTSLTVPPTLSPSSNTVGVSSLENPQANPPNSSAIAASIVGGMVFVSLVILVALFMRRRQQRGVKEDAVVDEVDDDAAAGKSLPLVTTDIAEESDEDVTPKAGDQYRIAADDTRSLASGGEFLITVENPNTPDTGRNVQRSQSDAASVSPSTASVSTDGTVVAQQEEPADVKKASGGAGFLCALQVIDNACICHVSKNK